MTGDGSFSQATREAVLGRDEHRCLGCGATSPLTLQHRRARGMGGTRSAVVASPANALVLCGSGTTGCHGWAEANPRAARELGWRLDPGDDPTAVPVWGVWSGWGLWRMPQEDGGWRFPDVTEEPFAPLREDLPPRWPL